MPYAAEAVTTPAVNITGVMPTGKHFSIARMDPFTWTTVI